MDPDELNARLSRLSTAWTMVLQAHGESEDARLAAQKCLLERYQGAIYRYLLGAVRDPDAADELFQEFAVQFLRGGFRHADPDRGRFRDYLKTSLAHLVGKYKRRQHGAGLQPLEDCELAAPSEHDEEFLNTWRRELLAKTWAALAELARQSGQPYYAVLKFRAEYPDVPAAQMAEQLTAQLKPERPYTDTGVRKTLQRTREKFAELLLDEVAHSLGNPALDHIEQELIELRLLAYCRPALGRRRGRR